MGLFDRAHDAPVDAERLARDVHNGLTSLREAIDSGAADTLANARKYLADYEENVARPRAIEAAATRKVLENVVQAVETGAPINLKTGDLDYARAGVGRDTIEYKSFVAWATDGKINDLNTNPKIRNLTQKKWRPGEIDFKALRTDTDFQGGYLVPMVLDNQIRKHITEISPVRAHARVRPIRGKTMDIPVRLSIPIAGFEGEGEAATTDQSTYGSEQVTAYRQTVKIPATLDMMMSSAFDLEMEIAMDVGESFAQGEGLNFLKGNGRKSPQGILSDTRVVGYTTATTAEVTWSDFTSLAGSLKRGMQPWFFMNRRTLAYAQALTSSIGVPIWQPVAGNQPATIFGYPYDANMIDLDDAATGTGAKPVIFADLYRGYEIYDMVGINCVRDDLTQADKAITNWIFRRYLTGRCVLPECIGVMTVK
jgi:HK97 family phage major capsid protein